MKTITVDGLNVAECEDCHKPIKQTSEVHWGFVSPESSDVKATSVMGIPGIEAVEKIVCRECYLKAYERVHPGIPLPELIGGDTYEQPT